MKFETILPGVPLSVQAKNRKKYRDWIQTVRETSQRDLSAPQGATESGVAVTITTYYTSFPLDVDNVIKPILDGMKGPIYVDDSQVWSVHSLRRSRRGEIQLTEKDVRVEETLTTIEDDFVHVVAEWS